MSDYALEGPRWASPTITWSFAPAGGSFTNAVTGAYQDIVRAAFARWAQVTVLTFKEVPDSASVGIRVGWGNLTGTELGSTAYSSLSVTATSWVFRPGTILRLEDPATLPVGTGLSNYYQGTTTTLYQTVLHEIGHALGLAHSTKPSSVMYPSIGLNDPDLSTADIQGIQSLYGAAVGGTTISAPVIAATATASNTLTVYRFFDQVNGTQFLTASASERATVLATRPDLTYEGPALGGIAPATDKNSVPVYRFFDTTSGTHFYTTSQSEQITDAATRPDLVAEDPTFYEHATAQPGDQAVYRFFDKNDGTHFYTASDTERASITATRPDMAYEGVAFYAPSLTPS